MFPSDVEIFRETYRTVGLEAVRNTAALVKAGCSRLRFAAKCGR